MNPYLGSVGLTTCFAHSTSASGLLRMNDPYTQSPASKVAVPQTSGKATATLILGLLSLVFSCLTALPALIVGTVAIGEINRSQGALTGKGLAFAGMIVGVMTSLATVAMGVIMFLLIAPAINVARQAAQTEMQSNNMRQVGIAMQNYHDVFKSFPYVGTEAVPMSWRVSLLPYVEQGPLYDQFDFSATADSAVNVALTNQMPEIYGTDLFAHGPSQSPLQIPMAAGATEQPPVRSSQVSLQSRFGGPNSGPGTTRMQDFLDGTSNTVMAVLASPETLNSTWIETDSDYLFDPSNPAAGLYVTPRGQYLVLMVDGSINRISQDIDPEILKNLMLRDDGNPITDDFGY